jgi:hypothetical protein
VPDREWLLIGLGLLVLVAVVIVAMCLPGGALSAAVEDLPEHEIEGVLHRP